MNQFFSFCIILVTSVSALATSDIVAAQTSTAKSPGGNAEQSTRQTGKPADRAEEALTPTQMAKVKSVLAPYKMASLKADDAKLIKRTLRDSGMRRGRALDAALLAAGFDPRRLDELDPPPARLPHDGNINGGSTMQSANPALK
jgi:hypothetical protein